MKKTTVTKYETSDGKSFLSAELALGHELLSKAQELNTPAEEGGDVPKMTVPRLVEIIASNPGEFAKLLEYDVAETEE